MQYNIRIGDRIGRPDVTALTLAIFELDPAAVLDLDPARAWLRVSSSLDRDELARLCVNAGHAVAREDVVPQRSECCGGCGG